MPITLRTPEVVVGHEFTGVTTLDLDAKFGDVVFRDCTFDAAGDRYALLVPSGRKPRAGFERCTFKNASGKLALAAWCGFFGCDFYHAPDGVFCQVPGSFLHLDGCTIDIHADLPEHGDCVQSAGGSYLTVKNSTLSVRGTGGNSCVFLESIAGRNVRRVRIVGNSLIGGGYLVWSIVDPNNPGPPNEDVVVSGNHGSGWAFGPVAWTPGSEPVQFGNSWQERKSGDDSGLQLVSNAVALDSGTEEKP